MRIFRPKEKRSSSFGPLSIIRLSPSPLARTPSPSPEYDNAENERRFLRKTQLFDNLQRGEYEHETLVKERISLRDERTWMLPESYIFHNLLK